MRLVAAALGLLVVDGVVAWVLVVRRPAVRRAAAPLRTSLSPERSTLCDRANDDLLARQRAVRAQRPGRRPPIAAVRRPQPAQPVASPATVAAMIHDADLLAVTDALVYDPRTWER